MRTNFYTLVFTDSDGRIQQGRTFATIKAARKHRAFYLKFGSAIRIMMGGPGGIEVF